MTSKLIALEQTEEMLEYLHPVLQKYPKTGRTLAIRTENAAYKLYESLITMNMQRELRYRLKFLDQADIDLKILFHLVRLGSRFEFMQGKKNYAILSEHLVTIGKLIGGLIKAYRQDGVSSSAKDSRK